MDGLTTQATLCAEQMPWWRPQAGSEASKVTVTVTSILKVRLVAGDKHSNSSSS